jgi:hypothetical protein
MLFTVSVPFIETLLRFAYLTRIIQYYGAILIILKKIDL